GIINWTGLVMANFLVILNLQRSHSELDSESGATELAGCRPLRYRIKSGMTHFFTSGMTVL
ncbi:MAG: hypothetical protein P1U47_17000, partial [Zhongshania sp.]|uniref:hypothetical protein n=1 Tax=Zhongshania sp. TaxID=1971902 RepID=UPI002612471F